PRGRNLTHARQHRLELTAQKRALARFFFPTFRRLARFDRLVLFTSIVLLGRAHNGGIDNLAAPRDITLGIEVMIEALFVSLRQSRNEQFGKEALPIREVWLGPNREPRLYKSLVGELLSSCGYSDRSVRVCVCEVSVRY